MLMQSRQALQFAAMGRAVATPLPTWITSVTVGQWGTVSGGSVSASGLLQSGGSAVITAWGGAVVNTDSFYSGATQIVGTSFAIWGGGHGDYSGNEVYVFGPLENDTPQWYRVRDRTTTAPDNVNTDGSGNPVSRHTGSTIVYVPNINSLVSPGGYGRHSDGGGFPTTHKFNFDTASPNSNQPWTTGVDCDSTWLAAYDPTTDDIVCVPFNGNVVGRYNVAANTYTAGTFKNPPVRGTGNAAAMDTSRRLMLMWMNGALWAYDVRSGVSNDYYQPSTTGTAPTGNVGMIYDDVDDRVVVWADGGKTLYTLTPPASSPYEGGNSWTWASFTPGSGSTPSAAPTNGTYGRFALAKIGAARVYLLLNSTSESMYFYRAA